MELDKKISNKLVFHLKKDNKYIFWAKYIRKI